MWIGQESGAAPVELVQYGVLGVVLLSIVAGWLWPRPAVDRLIQDKDRLIAERDRAISEQGARIEALAVEVRDLRAEVRDLKVVAGRDP